MDDEIKNLKLEIEVLKKRVASLEAIENRRKIFKIIKIIIIIILVIIIGIVGYNFYKYLINYYEQLNNMINNPLDIFNSIKY